jgi:hypothetical protein
MALPLTYSAMAVGQALVVVSPGVVIDSYAIPDNMLTAAFLVMLYWPRTTLLPEGHRSIRPTTDHPDA